MKNHWIQENYIKACTFAAKAHNGQFVPGTDLPYLVHLSLVSMEVVAAIGSDEGYDADLAIQCAWLHDAIEDPGKTYDEISEEFGERVADGVQALTKNNTLPKNDQMADSLNRIKSQPREVWIVKMADRITNLQPPPIHWSNEKKANYRKEALLIHEELNDANEYLATRLLWKAEKYKEYIRQQIGKN